MKKKTTQPAADRDFSGLWRVHTSRLLEEVLSNNSTAILSQPLSILGQLLAKVGERAAELNDPQLNALMVRMTIYSVADPSSPDYDPKVVTRVLAQAAPRPEAA